MARTCSSIRDSKVGREKRSLLIREARGNRVWTAVLGTAASATLEEAAGSSEKSGSVVVLSLRLMTSALLDDLLELAFRARRSRM